MKALLLFTHRHDSNYNVKPLCNKSCDYWQELHEKGWCETGVIQNVYHIWLTSELYNLAFKGYKVIWHHDGEQYEQRPINNNKLCIMPISKNEFKGIYT